LAANPIGGQSNVDVRPSFTIPMPSANEPRKESWFGSFGLGRKSTENVFGGLGKPSFNYIHESNSPNTGEKS